MGTTLSDGAKMGIVMIICCAIIAMVVCVAAMVMEWNRTTSSKVEVGKYTDHSLDFEAMAIYGEPLPMANVVAALDLHGQPERLCVQMEDLKGELDGTPYPVADYGTPKMAQLITLLKNYYDKEVYVYTYTTTAANGSKGNLQLCISELSHVDNADGNDQAWEHR